MSIVASILSLVIATAFASATAAAQAAMAIDAPSASTPPPAFVPPPPPAPSAAPSPSDPAAAPVRASPLPQAPAVPAMPSGDAPTIAILPFEPALPRYVFGLGPSSRDGDCATVERPGADLARRCTQEFIEAMVATRRFRVVDRDTIDRVLQEQNFHRVQGMEPRELARLGKLLGADRVIVTSLDLAGTSCRRIEVRASGFVTFEYSGGIELAYRVVQVASGEIEAIGRLTRTFDSKANPELRGVLSSPDGAATFFARQAAMAETFAVLDGIDPIKVAAIQDGGVVVLNQGRGRPMIPGTTMRVMIRGEPIRDPDTGAILSDEAGEAALIRVTDVDERISRAKIVVGDATKIAIGARCRTIDVPSVPN